MLEPTVSPRPSVVALATSMALLSLALGGCQRDAAEPSTRSPLVPPAPPTVVVAAAPVAALDRAGLLAAMDAVSSAYASGVDTADTTLSGRRFVVRQAFGCAAEIPPAGEANVESGVGTWSRSPDGKSLKVTLTPGDWTASPLITEGGEPVWEAVEGVWLTRPWMRTSDCPRVSYPTGVDDTARKRAPQTMGLASVFEADGSRLGRRNGRAYDFTVRGVDDQPAASPEQGYRLIIEGRMAAFPDGRSIRCRASGPDERPVCIAAVHVDRVAFEDASGAALSEWRGG